MPCAGDPYGHSAVVCGTQCTSISLCKIRHWPSTVAVTPQVTAPPRLQCCDVVMASPFHCVRFFSQSHLHYLWHRFWLSFAFVLLCVARTSCCEHRRNLRGKWQRSLARRFHALWAQLWLPARAQARTCTTTMRERGAPCCSGPWLPPFTLTTEVRHSSPMFSPSSLRFVASPSPPIHFNVMF